MGNNSPISNPFDQDDSLDKVRRWVTIAGGIILCIGALVGLVAIGVIPAPRDPINVIQNSAPIIPFFASPTTTRTSTPTLTITPSPTPSMTPSPTLNTTATRQVLDTTSTAVVVQTTVTQAANWPIIFSDTFDKNRHGWLTGTTDGQYARIDFETLDGAYRWDATAHKGFIERIRIDTRSLGNFFISVDAGQISGTSDADYGLILRKDTNGNYYYFAINNNTQEYGLDKYSEGQWSSVIPLTYSSAIAKGKPSRIAVFAEGSQFILFINDRFMAESNDVTIEKGITGLAMEIYQADLQGSFVFDNIVLRAP